MMDRQSPSKTWGKQAVTIAKAVVRTLIQVIYWLKPRIITGGKFLWQRSYAPASIYVLGVAIILGTCSPALTPWQKIEKNQVIKIVTVNGPMTYYYGAEGPTGFQYDLVKKFADLHGLGIEVTLAESTREIFEKLKLGEAQIATGVIITPKRGEELNFSVPIVKTTAQLVYRMGSKKPKSLLELGEGILEVGSSSSYAELLEAASKENPDLKWSVNSEFSDDELLFRVSNGDTDYTVADARLIRISQRYYPNLKVAFDIGEPQWIAWSYTPDTESRLQTMADEFLLSFKTTEEYKRILDRHFGHIDQLGYIDAVTLAKHVRLRLPLYEEYFKQAALDNNLDWRLIAAVGYQESHWNPFATSPTGVRGLMMLTNATARYLGVPDRLDPAQSIEGGARYLRELIDRLPAEIEEPDRTWIALATYNLGYGHIIDIRKIVSSLGGSPNHWPDIRNRLPLLMQAKWHRRTKYGYARGREGVKYVGNIRSYYDILRWMTSEEELPVPEGIDDPEAVRRELNAPEQAFEIDSPLF